MKAASFEYLRPTSLQEAAALLESLGEGAQILAGGQSLIPTLNLRLSYPKALIDINDALDACPLHEQDGVLRCGACVRHAQLEHSPLVKRLTPLLAAAIPHVAHPAIRNRGTPCGSVALADPAAELPACAVALGAEIVLQSASLVRIIPAEHFFLDLYSTARRSDELITELRFAAALPEQRFGFLELNRRHGDFAIVGVAIAVHLKEDQVASLRLVVFGCEPVPRLSRAAAAIAHGRAWVDLPLEAIAEAVASELAPMENAQGDAATKRQQARAITFRALDQMLAKEAA